MATRLQQYQLLSQIIDNATQARAGLAKAKLAKMADENSPDYDVTVTAAMIADWLTKVDARITSIKTDAASL